MRHVLKQIYDIGEIETVLIDQYIQCKGIGKLLLKTLDESIKSKEEEYDAIIMATLNPAMRHISTTYQWYTDLKRVPNSFATEWKKFFVESWIFTEEEFINRATTLIRYRKELNEISKEKILTEFLNS